MNKEIKDKIVNYLNHTNSDPNTSISNVEYGEVPSMSDFTRYNVRYMITRLDADNNKVSGPMEITIYDTDLDAVNDSILDESLGRYLVEDDAEAYEDDIQEISQEFSSANTSINSSKLPAIFKMVSFEPGTINIDYGGGKFDNVADYLTQYDVINLVYDPFNRSASHNREVIKTLRDAGGADTATCSNVLNVIKEPEVRKNVLQNISKLVKSDGKIYITVYEGTGKGDEKITSAGYQLNRKTADYLDEIREVFPDATRRGKLITATNTKSVTESLTEDKVPTDLPKGTLVDFGPYGNLYIVHEVDDETWWVSDELNTDEGWSIKKDLADKVISYPDDYEDDLDESTQVADVSSDKVCDIDLIDEDWRDGSFTEEDLGKYLDKINKDTHAIKYSLEKMIDKHPEYKTEMLSQIASIKDTFSFMYDNLSEDLEVTEDTVKRGNKWVNVGKSGKTHGEFRTKKQADAQRRAMFAQGYKESLDISTDPSVNAASELNLRKQNYLRRKHDFETLGEVGNNDVLTREEKMNIAKAEYDRYRNAMAAQGYKESLDLDTSTNNTDTELSNALISMINAEWDTIADYNKLIDLMTELGHDDMINVINDINSEENKHVGQLQECLKRISSVTDEISAGEDEGDEQLELLESDPNSDCIEDDCLDCEIVQLDLLDDIL